MDGVGVQLGIDILVRKYSTKTICYFDLVSNYMFLPQRTTEECVHMARAFLLHLLGSLPLCQWWANSVFKVANPLPGFWGGTEG